jgi:pimeloyl-ACP methyl ester carboxylesterase
MEPRDGLLLHPTTTHLEQPMQTVTSKDGSTIAYDRSGDGPVVILVGGALSYRRFSKMQEISAALAEHCTVINYDRRGRGDSSANGPYALEREIEDLAAIIDAEGGRASLWGWSSGGALALRAAAAGIGVERVSVYEVPFMVQPGLSHPTRDYAERLDELVAVDDRNGAVKHFLCNAVGIPAPFVALMRLMPMWKGLAATAHTLPHDWEALGAHTMYGAPLDPDEWAAVTMPALVVYGSKSPAPLREGSKALGAVLPHAQLHELKGANHNVKPGVVVPLLAEFFAADERGARGTVSSTARAE